jgi:hypothetical protein
MDIERVANAFVKQWSTPGKAALIVRETITVLAGECSVSEGTLADLQRVADRLDEVSDMDAMGDRELAAWFRLRGVREVDIPAMVDQFRGRSEDEMNVTYGELHGSMA